MAYDRLASVTLQQLRCLAAIGRERNFARAAESMMVSQPAISAQVRSLETIVGVRLIERTPGRRTLQFTEAGRMMLATADEVVRSLERTGDAIDAVRGELRGTVSFGASLYFGGYVVPALLASFRREYPGVNVHLEVHHTEHLVKRLGTGNFDLIALLGQLDDPGITSERCIAEDLVIVAAPGHSLVGTSSIALALLADEPWVLPDHPSHQRRLLEHKVAHAGTRLRVELEINDMQAQINAVAHGLGLGLVHAQAVEREIAAGRLAKLPVEGFPVQLDYYLAYRSDAMTPAAEVLKEHIKRFAPRPNPVFS